MPNQPVRLYTQRFRLLDGNGEPYLLRTESTTSFVFRYREHGASEGDQFTEVFRFNIDNVRNYIWVELPVGTFDYYMVLNVAPLRTIQTELRTTTFAEGIEPIETFGVPIVPDSHQGYSPYINPLDHCWYQYSDLDQCFYNTNIKAIDTSGSDHPIVDYIEQGCMSAVTSNAVANLKSGIDINLNLLNQQVNNLSNKPNVTVTLNGEKYEQDPEGDIDLGELTVKAYNDTNTRMLNANETIDGEIVPKGSLVQSGYDNHDSVIARSSNHDFYHLPLTSGNWWSLLSLNGGCQLNVKVTVYNNSYAGVVYISRKAYAYEAVTTSKELANMLFINQGSSMYYRLAIKGQKFVAMSIDIEVVDGYPTWIGVEVPSLDVERNIPMAVFLTDIPETLDYVDIESSPYVTSFSGLETNNFRVHVADCQVQFEDEIDTLPQTFSFVAMQDNTVVSVTDSTGSWTAVSSAMTEGQIGILTVTETERYWSYTVNRDLESVINKVTAITAYNRDSTTLYPSLKALTEYVDNSIDETAISSITVNNQIYYPSSGGFDLGNIAPTGYVSNVTGYGVNSISRSSLSLYNAYIREPRAYWYMDGKTALSDRQGPLTMANIITPMDASSWANIKKTLNFQLEGGKNVNDYNVPSLELLKQCVAHLEQGGGSGPINAVTSNTISNIENPNYGTGLSVDGAELFAYDNVNITDTVGYWYLNFGHDDIKFSMDYDTAQGFTLQTERYYPVQKIKVNGLVKEYDSTLKGFDLGNIGGGGGGLDSVTINGSAHTVTNNSVDLGTIKVQAGLDTFSANSNNLINIGNFSRPVNCKLKTNRAGWVKFSGNNSWFDVTVRNYEGTVRLVSYETNGGIRVLYTESGNRLNVYFDKFNSQNFYLYYGGNCNYYVKVNQGQIKITDEGGVDHTIHEYDEESNHQYIAQMETGVSESNLFLVRGHGNQKGYNVNTNSITINTADIDSFGTFASTNNQDTTIALGRPTMFVNDFTRDLVLTNTSTTSIVRWTITNGYTTLMIIDVKAGDTVRTKLEWIGGQISDRADWRCYTNTLPDTRYWNATAQQSRQYCKIDFAEDTEAIFECLGRQVRLNSHGGLFLLNESELQDTMWIYFSDSTGLTQSCIINYDYQLNIKVIRGSITVNKDTVRAKVITPDTHATVTIDAYSSTALGQWQLVSGYGDENATLSQHKKYHRTGGSLSSINAYMSVPACTRQTIHIIETLYTTATPTSWTAFLYGKDSAGNNYQISRQHSFETTYGKEVSYPLKWDVKLQKWIFDEQ